MVSALRLGESRCARRQFRGGHDLVNDIETQGILSCPRFAVQHYLERGFGAGESRQSLRSRSAGEQAQVDLRQADFRVGGRDAVVTTQRDF